MVLGIGSAAALALLPRLSGLAPIALGFALLETGRNEEARPPLIEAIELVLSED